VHDPSRPGRAAPRGQPSPTFQPCWTTAPPKRPRTAFLRARQRYNESVKDYNTELGKIRGAVVNKATGTPFKPRVYFAAAADTTAAPKVSF
jgi:hypothetical protein